MSNKGLIVAGYPGIGKSTLSMNHSCLDLESSHFSYPNTESWARSYAYVAIDLMRQGNLVFVSTHKEVISNISAILRDVNQGVRGCFRIVAPSPSIKKEWIEKLHKRYEEDSTDKNRKAWKQALNNFDDNIADIKASLVPVYWIEDINYSIDDLMQHLEFCRNYQLNE